MYLWAEVEVAVDGQDRVSAVTEGQRKETVATGLQKLLQQELSRRRQQRVFTVRSAHILRCTHTHRGLHPLQHKRDEGDAVFQMTNCTNTFTVPEM